MARSEASQYRKTQRMIEQTHGGYAGQSILEKLEALLDLAMNQHLDAKAALDTVTANKTRGEVRGLARAVGMMKSPYYPIRGLKQAEKDSASRVRSARARKQEQDDEGEAERSSNGEGEDG